MRYDSPMPTVPTVPEGYKPHERDRLRAERVQAEHDAGLHEFFGPESCCECRHAVEEDGHQLVEGEPASCACGRWNPTPKPSGYWRRSQREVREAWWRHATAAVAARAVFDPWPHMEPEDA